MESNDDSRWVMTLDTGLRLLGKVVSQTNQSNELLPPFSFVLQPAFEYMTQIKFTRGAMPQREEAVVAIDMVGDVPLHVLAKAYMFIDELPEWRQKEIKALIDEGLKSAEAFASRKRSGLVLAST